MRPALTALALLALLTSAPAQDSGPTRLPLRGNLRVRTAVTGGPVGATRVKVFPTLESGLFRLHDTRLDWVALADDGQRFSQDGWLAYRGAAALFTGARPALTALPGFEWREVPGSVPSPSPRTAARSVSLYGADHVASGQPPQPQWPALRVGRLLADLPAELPSLLIPIDWLRRQRFLSQWEELFYESLAGDLQVFLGGSADANPGDLLALDGPEFGAPELDGPEAAVGSSIQYPPIETLWGRPSRDLYSSLGLDRGASIARELQSPPLGITRMRGLARTVETQPGSAAEYVRRLQDQVLRPGDPPATQGPMERLPLVPGWPAEKSPEATRDNPQYERVYGEYFTLLEAGLSLFQSYGSSLSRSALEQGRLAWSQGTSDQRLAELPPTTLGGWDQLLNWLQVYDPRQTLVACLNQPNQTGPGVWVQDLDPRKLRNRPLTRERVALLELAYGQSAAPTAPPTSGGGSAPGGGSPAAPVPHLAQRLLPYYNLALRNGWRVAPCTGSDNLSRLDALAPGAALPAIRSTFTGLYPGQEDAAIRGTGFSPSGNSSDRIRAVQQALAQRRTFVSENPYVDALLYARDLSNGRLTVMGGSLFQGAGLTAPSTFEFTLQLDVPVRNQFTQNWRIRMEDIKLVEVVEREAELDHAGSRVRVVNVTRSPQPTVGDVMLSTLTAVESPILKHYTSGAVAQPGTSAGVGSVLKNYGMLDGSYLNPPDPETFPLPVTLTWRTTVRPHSPGGTLAYYVHARLPQVGAPGGGAGGTPVGSSGSAGVAITAPLWTVTDWDRFKSIDEDQ